MTASFSTWVVSWKFHAACYCTILGMDFGKEGNIQCCGHSIEDWEKRNSKPCLSFCLFQRTSAFQGVKLKSALSISCNMQHLWQTCCCSTSECCMMKCFTGPSILGRQVDFQGTLLYWLRPTIGRKAMRNAWHFIFHIHIFIPAWDGNHHFGSQFLLGFLVSVDSKHFPVILICLVLFLQMDPVK